VSVLSFNIHNLVEPKVRAEARLMVATAYADLLSAVIEEKTFRRIEDGLYVQIDKRLKGRQLKGLFIADTESRIPNFCITPAKARLMPKGRR